MGEIYNEVPPLPCMQPINHKFMMHNDEENKCLFQSDKTWIRMKPDSLG